jgi:hypothetical protein
MYNIEQGELMTDIDNSKAELQDLLQRQETERQAIEIYLKETYSNRVPEPLPPTKEDLSFWKIAGVEATLLSISAIGAVLFSAVRTGQLFFLIESKLLSDLNPVIASIFSFAAMFLALFAFEGYLLAVSFYKGRRLKAVKISNWGIFLSMTVIIMAGIFSGLPLVNLPENILILFNASLAIVTAFAAGFIVYLVGENIGFAFSQVETTREGAKEKHMISYQHWREAGIKAYHSSKTFKIGAGVRKNSLSVPQASVSIEPKENKSELTYRAIEQYHRANGKLPTVRELNELAGVSVGTAQNALKEYRERNNIIQPFRD